MGNDPILLYNSVLGVGERVPLHVKLALFFFFLEIWQPLNRNRSYVGHRYPVGLARVPLSLISWFSDLPYSIKARRCTRMGFSVYVTHKSRVGPNG